MYYSRPIRICGAVALLAGWVYWAFWGIAPAGFDILHRALGPSLALSIAVSIAIMLAIVAAYFRIFWLIPENRESHFMAAAGPVLVAAGALVLFAAPLLEAAAGATPVHFESWYGLMGVMAALVLAALFIAPLQFVGRDWPPARRSLSLLAAAGLPLALALFPRYASPLARPLLLVLALALSATVLLAAEAARAAIEFATGLRRHRLVGSEPGPAPSYHAADARTVGIALSGGGYRASLFALGAMMYVHDACTAAGAPRRRVMAVTSVSGGSIANGVVAHGVRLGRDDAASFDRVARILIRDTVTGGMFDWWTLAYYACFVGALALCAAAALIGLRTSGAVLWRAAFIPSFAAAIATGLFFAGSVAARIAPDRLHPSAVKTAFALLAWVLLAAFGYMVLARTEWRLGLALLDGAVVVILAPVLIWASRGVLIQRHYDRLLRQAAPGGAARLADIGADTHHVFCATEVQFGQTAYLAPDAIRCAFFKETAPDALPTALAVRASAAFPGGFPPVVIAGMKGEIRAGADDRARKQSLATGHLLLVDGGVRDNLAASWFDLVPPLDEYVVVSAAPNRHSYRKIPRLLGFGEFIALLSASLIPYNTRERNQRLALAGRLFGGDKANAPGPAVTQGALIHIEDSPTDLAHKFLLKEAGAREAGPWLRGGPQPLPDWDIDQWLMVEQIRAAGDASVFRDRAEQALAHLEALESRWPDPPEFSENELLSVRVTKMTYAQRLGAETHLAADCEAAWWMRARRSALVATTLSRLQYGEAMNLVLHGYCLAMANLHVCAGWPLLDSLGPDRLADLFAEVAPAQGAVTEAERAAFARAQAHPLSPGYPFVVVFAFYARVRQCGEFVSKKIVVALALDRRGRAEVLGTWLAPARQDFRELAEAGLEAILRQERALQSARHEFWKSVLSDLRDRGVHRIAVCAADLALDRDNADFTGLAEAFRETWPGAALYPRPGMLALVTAFLSFKATRIAHAHLKQVLLADDAAAARSLFATLSAEWSEDASKAREVLAGAMDLLEPFLALPVAARRALLDVDEAVDALSRALRAATSERGPASTDGLLLLRARADLERQRKLMRRITLPPAVLAQLEPAPPRTGAG